MQGARRRRASKRAVDDERRRNATLIGPSPSGIAAARGRLRRQTSSTTCIEVVCVGLLCIRPLGAATVATGVLKQSLGPAGSSELEARPSETGADH